MNEDQISVARRLVACKRWPDRADHHSGTRIGGGGRVVFRETLTGRQWLDAGWPTSPDEDWLPDLDDAATIGWLEELVRKVRGDPGLFAKPWAWRRAVRGYEISEWVVLPSDWDPDDPDDPSTDPLGTGPTRAAALVAALEAAP